MWQYGIISCHVLFVDVNFESYSIICGQIFVNECVCVCDLPGAMYGEYVEWRCIRMNVSDKMCIRINVSGKMCIGINVSGKYTDIDVKCYSSVKNQ